VSRTLEQERAAFAWEKTERCDAEFKSRISGTTALIMENGLMQALAYYKEKKHDRVWRPIAEWLARQLDLPDLLRGANAEQLFCGVMKKLQDAEADQLLFATEEALAIAEWLRRWAKARA
jgi:CRISPR type III-B/RAMP module-associated protein Cmr5